MMKKFEEEIESAAMKDAGLEGSMAQMDRYLKNTHAPAAEAVKAERPAFADLAGKAGA
jgi:hypothetical protein